MPDTFFYLIVLALGFAGGYGVREYMSRRRHRRAREHAADRPAHALDQDRLAVLWRQSADTDE